MGFYFFLLITYSHDVCLLFISIFKYIWTYFISPILFIYFFIYVSCLAGLRHELKKGEEKNKTLWSSCFVLEEENLFFLNKNKLKCENKGCWIFFSKVVVGDSIFHLLECPLYKAYVLLNLRFSKPSP